ncbi:MAG TPA: 2Fe-2S iron-sulfur cluster-binding protein, partial [Hyphomicrobiaceae bacterium]|nr:2Fe-2S iron-sulfur cluster-binding protein [Hyphomicrobiaceae bacterium]
MSGPFRLEQGGRIDRARRLRFRFDDREYEGHPGDTLASALLANDVTLLGRSFKYHRPRGMLAAGIEEPSALVEIGRDGRREPNQRATTVELFDGLEARSQNRWPSLRHDFGAINQRLARFMPVGFYYKTFKWPSAFWERLYEPTIRRMAGLGTAASEPDPDHYEHVHAHCDVLVVGSGTAGLSAARVAADSGARAILIEQDSEIGASLLLAPDLAEWRRDMFAALGRQAETQLLPRTTAIALYDHNVVAAVERVGDHMAAVPKSSVRQRFWIIRAKEIVLATGAIERLIAFPDNDRPGVMLSSAALSLAERYGVAVGRAPVLFTNNDEAYEAAFALARAGVVPRAIVDVRK